MKTPCFEFFLLIPALIAAGLAFGDAAADVETRTEEPIHDLNQWVADNFADGPDGEVNYWRPERFELDINHDGTPEVFVTSIRMHGNGGGPHLVFQKRGNSYHYMGQLPGRRQTMRVLPLDEEGSPRVMSFTNSGGGRGIAMVWKWDGQGFALVSEEVVAGGDSGTEEGRKRMEELFGLGVAGDQSTDARSREIDVKAAEREALESERADPAAEASVPDLQEARFGISEAVIERFFPGGDLFQESEGVEAGDLSGQLRVFFSRATGVNFETPGSSLDYDGYTISVVHTLRDLDRIRLVFLRLFYVRPSFPGDPAERFPVRIRISGHVRKPGPIEYYSLPSLARVVKDTGGLTPLGGPLYILRSAGDELELIRLFHLDLQNPEVADLLLQDCDWIHVGNPHLDPWPREWPRHSPSDPSGLDLSDRSRLPESW